ncbi:hypothetical protein [Roseomonas sp. AR75]|uniref:hypothetical protein n=1 Tax=Roseomonas sp. AR75 TaxID=2562311 RepID=UPI0010C0F2F9|nr:hypothetical protein [Roseomonas sp. AR75]
MSGVAQSFEQPVRRRRWPPLVILLLPVVFALLPWVLGKDNNVDLMHYHYYLPHAWLNGRFAHDLFPAGFHTFFNPLVEVPFYWLNQRLPGVAVAGVFGALHGLGGVLIWALARRVLRPATLTGVLARPQFLPVLVALLGTASAGSLLVVGTAHYDTLVGLPVILALLLVAQGGPALFARITARGALRLVVAGFAAGAAIGLKQTVAPISLGVGLALLLVPGPVATRMANAACFALGGALGVLAFSGFWLWHLWELTGNPLFPYFNEIFRSPFAPAGNNRTLHAMPRSLWEALAWPFIFTWKPWRIDGDVRDPKLLIAYLAVPLGIACALLRRQRGDDTTLAEPRIGLFLLVAGACAYLLWLGLFSIYRYILPLEMLAPLLIVVAIGFLPLRAALRSPALALGLLAAAPIQPSTMFRLPWGGGAFLPYVHATVPAEFDYRDAIVVAPGWSPGWQPYGYTIPFFPPQVAFVHVLGAEHQDARIFEGFLPWIERRIAEHRGPIYLLYTPPHRDAPAASIAKHGLVADFAACRPIRGSIGRELALCPVRRAAPNAS